MSAIRLQVRRHPALAALAAAAVVLVAGVGLYLFQPWQLFVDTQVDEAFPGARDAAPAPDDVDGGRPADAPTSRDEAADTTGGAGAPATSGDAGGPGADDAPDDVAPVAGPVALAGGSFVDRSHPTRGQATIFEVDGRQVLRFDGLETDNGPDLFVYLTTAAADAPSGEVETEFVNLGRLKGNVGNQNYELPDGVDLSRYQSVAIWCDRFNVLFGAAPLTPA